MQIVRGVRSGELNQYAVNYIRFHCQIQTYLLNVSVLGNEICASSLKKITVGQLTDY